MAGPATKASVGAVDLWNRPARQGLRITDLEIERLVMHDRDVLRELIGAGNQARMREIRAGPGIDRIRVAPLLEQHDLFAAIGLEAPGELDVHEARLGPHLVLEVAHRDVELADAARPDSRRQHANNHLLSSLRAA